MKLLELLPLKIPIHLILISEFIPFRDFLLSLLKSGSRKLGLHVKEIFTEILKYTRWDISKGNFKIKTIL